MTYSEQRKDPRWQRKRLEVLQSADFKCEVCTDPGSELQVHHLFYKKDCPVWDYDKDELMCVCDACHGRMEYERLCVLQMIGKDLSALFSALTGLRALGLTNKQIVDRMENWLAAYSEFSGQDKK